MRHMAAIAIAAASVAASGSQPADGYVWERVTDRYGWSPQVVYVLNAVAQRERLWAFEARAVYRSADGAHWDPATVAPSWQGTVPAAAVVAFRDRLWTVGSFSEAGRRSDVWASTDGGHWERVSGGAPWPTVGGHSVVALHGRLWVLAASGSVWSSPDGERWSHVCDCGPWSPAVGRGSVAFRDRLWVVADDARLWSSPDGVRWSLATADAAWGERFRPGVAVYDDRLWVMGGAGKSDAWWSADGVRWTRATRDAGWFPRAGMSVAVLGDALYVMGGKSGISANSNPQDVWRMRRATPR